MIANKYINYIITFITILAMMFSLLVSSNLEGALAVTINEPQYVTKVFDKDKITEINIDIEENKWNELLKNAIAEEYVMVNITINGEKFYNVGIRAKGNSSLSSIAGDSKTNRYSFKVKFDEYVKGQTLYGLEKLVLNNNYADTSSMKEYLSYDILTRMGVATPVFAYTNLKVNGETWGLYLAVESIEESFLERNYGSSEGNLYKPEGMEVGGWPMEGGVENIQQIPNGGQRPRPGQGNNGEEPQGHADMEQISGINTGEIPDMSQMPPMNNSEMPDMSQMPPMNNGEMPDMSQMPSMNNGEMSDMPQMQQEKNGQGLPKGGMGSKGGANLVWTDEDPSSYSTVLDSAVFKSTTDEDKEKVIQMIKNLNASSNLESCLNVDEILRYFAANTFLVNLDSYASNMKHNYYLYEKDGIFEILPWDYNMSFGGFQSGNASSVINFPIDSPVTDSLENSPLIGKLLDIPEYRERYHKYLMEIVEYVNSGDFVNVINNIDTLISDYIKNDPTAFYTFEQYNSAIQELKTFGSDRVKSIAAQLEGSQPSTTYGNIETTLNLNTLGTMGGKGENNHLTDKNVEVGNMKVSNMEVNNMNFNGMLQSNKPINVDKGINQLSFIEILFMLGVTILIFVIAILFVKSFRKKSYNCK